MRQTRLVPKYTFWLRWTSKKCCLSNKSRIGKSTKLVVRFISLCYSPIDLLLQNQTTTPLFLIKFYETLLQRRIRVVFITLMRTPCLAAPKRHLTNFISQISPVSDLTFISVIFLEISDCYMATIHRYLPRIKTPPTSGGTDFDLLSNSSVRIGKL